MKFYTFLNEMASNDALKVFGLKDDSIELDELRKKYLELSKKNHPDLGGSEEDMKKINDAYETLKTLLKKRTSSSKIDWDKINQEYRDLGQAVLKDLLFKFKPEVFIKYFKDVSNYDFIFEMINTRPNVKDYSPSYAGFDCQFYTKDKDVVFSFDVSSTSLSEIKHSKGLGSDNIDYSLHINTFIVAHNKKHKLGKSQWTSHDNHKMFTDPSLIFPKNKIAKILMGSTSNRPFSKRDMIAVLTTKLGAHEGSKDSFIIPLSGTYYLVIYRMTFLRTGGWGFNTYLYDKHKSIGAFTGYTTFPETEETATKFTEFFHKLKRINDPEKIIDEVNNFLKRNKNY